MGGVSNATDERVALETLKYLTDQAYGRARQSIDATAAFALTRRVICDL
jgi:hypothetical protein